MGMIKTFIIGAVVLVGAAAIFGGGRGQTADLGQVLDRTERGLIRFSEKLERKNIDTLTPKEVGELNYALKRELNAPQKFYGKPIGVAMTEAASFIGYSDLNANNVWEQGDEQLFLVEIDNENKRLIATDMSGNATHSGSNGFGGFLFISLGDRQRAAGIAPGSFNDRKTTPRSSYRAPKTARTRVRSGGIAGGK